MASVGVTVKTLVCLSGCVGVAAFAYGFAMDRYFSCIDLNNRWLIAVYINFYINVVVLAAWVFYKESSWIMGSIVTVLLVVLGSIATSGYVIMRFFKFSPEESSKDPLYFVLARHHRRDVTSNKRGPSVVTARVIFSAVGCLMLGIWIYLLIVDGSPFRAKVFSPCVIGASTDFYANVAILSVWIVYKESSWISAFFWILLLVCFGSVGTCVYIVRKLFNLSPQQPISLVIFNSRNRFREEQFHLIPIQSSVTILFQGTKGTDISRTRIEFFLS